MEANYETRYTTKEYEILDLKKKMKQVDPTADLMVDDPNQEMNELVESDPELYEGDSDESGSLGGDGYNEDLSDDVSDVRDRRMDGLFE
jgi:hypothetical protein